MPLWLLALAGLAFAHEPITTKVTFNKEVVRILDRRCNDCHREGGNAFSLATYADARPWAKAIKEEVLERRMPPWNAVKGIGEFKNDRSLTSLEKELLVDWIEGGAPKGEDKDLPAAVAPLANGLGRPDLVVPGPSPTADRWLAAWEFRPADPAKVGKAEFWIAAAGQRRYLGSWTATDGPTILPDGVGILLPAGSRIALSAPGKLALWFARKPAARVLRNMRLSCGSVPLPQGISALAIRPQNSLEILARHPDQTVEGLGLFAEVPEKAVATYWFRNPVTLPPGTTLEIHSPENRCSAYLSYVAR